jgi:hypothetical protein
MHNKQTIIVLDINLLSTHVGVHNRNSNNRSYFVIKISNNIIITKKIIKR